MIRVLPLWQPWASLIALGAKQVETRSWQSPNLVGQRIAIHAAKRTSELGLCEQAPFNIYVPHRDRLPLGAIICTALVARIAEITAESADRLEIEKPYEFAFGDYTPGRYAWVLRDVEPISPPVPFKAKQGLNSIDPALLSGEPQEVLL